MQPCVADTRMSSHVDDAIEPTSAGGSPDTAVRWEVRLNQLRPQLRPNRCPVHADFYGSEGEESLRIPALAVERTGR